MLKQLGLLSVGWACLGLTLACKDEPQPSTPTNTTGTAAGSSSGGSANTPDGSGGAGDDGPVRKGERGSSCNADNDCSDELSCVVTRDCPVGVNCANKSCQPSNFGLMGTGKRCFLHECSAKADCCGDLPQEAPAKCDNRTSICNTPNIPGCVVKLCTADLDCGPGTCTPAVCSVGGAACNTTADCAANTCDLQTMKCTVSQADCSTFACTTSLCPTRYCNCKNPDYLPSSPICTDQDCEGICGFTCTEERCVVDKRCGSDAECGATTPYCSKGACIECRTSDDCEDEECMDGRCGPECESDTQCKLFEACQNNKCEYVGCRTDRECVLKAGQASSTQDPRLAKCRVAEGRGTCVYPCEIDAQCAPSEVCLNGTCEYIGCETDAECKTIAGLHNLPAPSPERPWTTTAECRAEATAAP
jgi:hypothetical protein